MDSLLQISEVDDRISGEFLCRRLNLRAERKPLPSPPNPALSSNRRIIQQASLKVLATAGFMVWL